MRKSGSVFTLVLTLLFMGFFLIPDADAQVTTSAIRGVVTDQDGNPLPGANVVAIHEPSGTTQGAATRTDGRYNLSNLRPGGPYTVTATFVGYRSQTEEGIRLELGQEISLDFTLVDEAIELDEIVEVIGRVDPVLSPGRTGAARNISSMEIEHIPSIQREIWDYTRLTPQISGLNVAGRNNRYNSIQVDGAVLNDVFGLPATGTPGGQTNANPISMDAIEEFQVNIAPYDVRESGFTGGSINAITRSGSNTFEGSAYFYGRNQDFIGSTLDGADVPVDEFTETQTGFRLGGPIVRDQAFFFVSGEIKRRSDPMDAGLPGSGAGTIFDLPPETMDEIINIAENEYGYSPGGYRRLSTRENDVKLFLRFDYNLSDQHRLTFRHNYVDALLDRGLTRNPFTFALEDQQYEFVSEQHSSVLQLNSTWGRNLVSQARVAYTRIRDQRDYGDAEPFPQVSISTEGGTVRLGMERFSHANRLDQDIVEITAHASYFTGDHTITFGTHNEIFAFDNLFIQDFYGSYQFPSIEAFQEGRPTRYEFSYSRTDDPRHSADWAAAQIGLFAQNEWTPLPTLNLTFGLRMDIPIFIERPLHNPTFEDQFNMQTDEVPSGNILWSPRFGFNWDVRGDRSTQLRGGIGVFSGRTPGVWLSNQYSNTGMDFGRIDLRPWHFEEGEFPAGFFSPDPLNQPRPEEGEIETTEINITDPNFRFPQSLRADIAIDQALPFDLVGTLELLYSNSLNDIAYQNLNLQEPERFNPVDGRPIYPDAPVSEDFTNVILLDNTSKGYEYNITAQIQRLPRIGWYGSLAYVYGRATDVNSGSSSRAISNWQFNAVPGDPNNPPASTSQWETRHRIISNLSYRFEPAPRWVTTISAIYDARSGRPFSHIYNVPFGVMDPNNDGAWANDLAYIPDHGDEDQITLVNGSWDDIHAFIDNDPYLSDYRGEIVPRNAGREPWTHRLDLRLSQQIPSIGGQRFELILDVINALNMLNSDWGQMRFHSFQEFQLFTFEGYDEDGYPMMSFDHGTDPDETFTISDLGSRWQMQLGIRYTF